MTVKVIEDYVDKYTGILTIKGRVLRYVPEERARELMEAGKVVEVKEDRRTGAAL